LGLVLSLSAFTHLWNPTGFPYGPSNDEGIYIRRAMNVLLGQGPQESFLYDHPYFAQIFLASALQIIGYPYSLLHSTLPNVDVHSIEMLYTVPRVLMGLLAVVDTFLIYKIAEGRYNNKTVALIASILFAVMPTTWIARRVMLESIQLPFLLSSILFAIYLKGDPRINNKNIILILLSGIFLGIAIFTKITVFSLIPLVAFLILTNNKKNLKTLGLWFIPVILIPLIWPAYAISIDEFNLWLHGLYFQTHRGVQSLFESIIYDFQIDPILISIGIFGFAFAVIKKEFLILLWLFPFLGVLYFVGFVSYWHLLPLLPAFCIAAARLLEDLPKRITTANKVKNIINNRHHHHHNHHQQLQNKLLSLLPFIVTTEIVFFGFLLTTYVLIINDNLIHFKAIAFISQDLNNNNNKTVLISNPFYSWIPKYVFKLNNYQIVDYYDNIPIKAQRVIFVVDSDWKEKLNNHMIGNNMEKNFNLYGKNNITTFGDIYDNVTIYEYDLKADSKGTASLSPAPAELTPDRNIDKQFFRYNDTTSPSR
jgi:Dolichyl-phosphate-mannose-protein mannosyltransferase